MQKQLLTAMAVLCFAFAAAQPTTNGLVFYLPMNGNFTDAGPNNITVTATGAITAGTNSSGTANSAMVFTNTVSPSTPTQYATPAINSAINFAAGTNYTVAHFFKINSLPSGGGSGFFDNQLNYGGYGSWCWLNGGGIQVNFNSRGTAIQSQPAAVPINYNTWYHLAVTRSGTVLTMYINGVQVATINDGSITPSYVNPARIGTMNYVAPPLTLYNGFNGSLDELRVYNRALTLAEIGVLASSPSGGPLPVKLTSFTASKNAAAVLLKWTTQYEQNSSHFNIQRGTDGISFSNIATLQASGNTGNKTEYQFTDDKVTALTGVKTVYYRLQQVDLDGRSQLSGIVLVKYDAAATLLTLLQNPAVNDLRLQVSLPKTADVQLVLTDAAGRALLLKQVNMGAGQTFTSLPVQGLMPGTYYVTVTAGSAKQSMAFIKQ